jgi:hypothetical protein
LCARCANYYYCFLIHLIRFLYCKIAPKANLATMRNDKKKR